MRKDEKKREVHKSQEKKIEEGKKFRRGVICTFWGQACSHNKSGLPAV
jgi:hypothetical protein